MHPDARTRWFLHRRMLQAAAFCLAAASAPAADPVPEPGCAAGTDTLSGDASLVVMIDHSASMRQLDPGQERYRAAARLLERVGAIAPGTEAALVVFSDILHFDWRDDAFFRPAFPANPGMQFESYVPFTRLGKSYPDGRSGLDTLKAFLRCGNGARPAHATERRTGWLSDFPLAFEAARAAFRGSSARPSRRMLVVITDGDAPAASAFGGDSALARFRRGAELPATYILHAGAGRNEAGDAMGELAANIAGNGYSAANPRGGRFPVDPADWSGAPAAADRILADLANPVPDPLGEAALPCVPDAERARLPAILAGNPMARPAVAPAAPGTRPWLASGLPAAPPGAADWSCCRLSAGPPGPEEAERYIHVTLESDRPFAARAKVFSRLGEPVAGAEIRVDERAFASLPASPGGRKLDLYWDGRAEGGAPAATGAYVLKVEASHLPGPGIRRGAPVVLSRRVGVLRGR